MIVLRDEQMRTLRKAALLAMTLGLLFSSNLQAQQPQPTTTPKATQQPAATVAKQTPLSRQLTKRQAAPSRLRDTRASKPSDRQPPPPILPEEFVPSRLANRAMTVMGLLIAACIGAIWYGQRHSKAGRLGSSSGDLQVLDTLSIAPRCCVHLLRVGGQKYLVARDQAGIKSVTAVSAFAATLDDLADNRVDASQDVAAPSVTDRSWASRSEQWRPTLNR